MPLVLFEIRDNIALLTLNNPEKRNMLTLEVCEMIVDYVAQAEQQPDVKALIVTGNGPTFCAGGQLTDITADQLILENIYSGFLSIAQCELPTIAAVNGPAVGAGFNMAVGCDVRIVTEKARFEPRFFGLGLHPGGGNSWMLRQLVNWNTAAGMLLFSQSITGQEAVDKGLAWKCVKQNELVEAAFDFTANIRDLPKELLLRTKQTLRQAGGTNEHNEIVNLETAQQVWSINQPYAKNAISAMIDKISSKT
ncbi:MAG: enoyl-CoA hydratase [Porticoccaceae bacterium]|jgi:enoyl-CoA hydratase|nr:enoyl-CoA hydratase [Porticoccaceae bacterium]MBT3797679.1 enoyl-CoA hydratase [Porticoccaceae bacterium]MBT4164965.1 enoyl-CoA hydratase [Porticoccaceae bacterium]MBT4210603.1 enoyl-CoA hydratase [Porticoccaceae bacterium]MBT4591431.1 enoyl-CoA hydratase [Porticoccaceae bacterium]